MRPFEEQYTAWVDGRLTAAELEEFERTLPDRTAAEADRAEVRHCTEFLRRHAAVPSLTNADFFSHQLLERIAAEERLARPAPTPTKERRWFSLPGLAWACAFCAVGLIAYHEGQSDRFRAVALSPSTALETPVPVYDATIIKTSTEDPAISATSVSAKDGTTVLWLDGLDYLPASYKLQ